MKTSEIESKLSEIVSPVNKDEFIYQLLSIYGISKTSITRLKKGDYNLSKVEGEVLYKNKLFFKVEDSAKLLSTIDVVAKEVRITRQNPRFVIITDFVTILARDLKTGNNKDFPIGEIANYYDFFLPLSGAEVYKARNDNKADREAAYQLALLYDNLVNNNPEYKEHSHKLNIFLSRLLFCFFAEDTDIFSAKSAFTNALAQQTQEDGSDVSEFLNRLFERLNTKEGKFPAFLQDFPYVNGGLFKDDLISPQFSKKSREILLECGNLDWSEINPDIFGSMIQAVADPEERSDLGMHYTSVPNILKLIKPLFLDELYEDFENNFNNYNALNRLIIRISKIKFFDPACGSGNFLIITYKEIRDLEIKIIQRLVELDAEKGQFLIYSTSIRLSQFFGIEIKDFAHEMARLSLWIAEHQMNKVFDDRLESNGKSEPILPLKEAGNIICANAARYDWEKACPKKDDDEIYIIGNPPYEGARKQGVSQKEDLDLVLHTFKKYRDLDYISIWFYKGAKYITECNSKLAFVSTNSINQGQQVALIWPNILNDKIEIDFAYQSFKWENNAKANAGVTVIIIGLRNKSNKPKYLFSEKIKKEASNISPYLRDEISISIPLRETPLSRFPKMSFGNMPNDAGALILSESEKEKLINENSNTIPFIKRFIGSTEFINESVRYCLWFDREVDVQKLNNPFINKRVNDCLNHRLNSKDKGTQKLAKRL